MLAINLTGDALRDLLDPRTQANHKDDRQQRAATTPSSPSWGNKGSGQ